MLRLFIKFAHSLVAIELLTFCNNEKTILLLKRALGIGDFFKPVRKQDWFTYGFKKIPNTESSLEQ